jgi:uncharacterized membrane protein YdbT with pleckstrin-like domain
VIDYNGHYFDAGVANSLSAQRGASMGYIESNLLPDESIAYKARLHGIVFWKPVALTVLGIIFLVIQPIIGSIVVAIGLLALIPPLVNYTTSEFGATNKRVIIKVGLIRRRTLELLLRHVEAILVDQSVMGRILNYGSVTLTGTGGVRETFGNISNPLEFRRRVQGEAAKDLPARDALPQ